MDRQPGQETAAFGSHLAGILLGGTDVVEANWGFTWTDESFARPATPVFNALLALLLGSTTVSVYTACATENWGPLVDMDPDGLRAEGVDPALHAPPYTPGAPLAEGGAHQANAQGLRLLSTFLERHGDLLSGSVLDRDAVVLVDRALPEVGAWQRTGRTVLAEVADAVHGQLADSGRLIGLGWLGEPPPPAADGTPVPVAVLRAGHPDGDGPGELTLPAASRGRHGRRLPRRVRRRAPGSGRPAPDRGARQGPRTEPVRPGRRPRHRRLQPHRRRRPGHRYRHRRWLDAGPTRGLRRRPRHPRRRTSGMARHPRGADRHPRRPRVGRRTGRRDPRPSLLRTRAAGERT